MDTAKILEMLEESPHTYNTILKEAWCNSTRHNKMRRKLNKLFKYGMVYKTLISLSRIMFYLPEKEYTIFFTISNVYYTREFTETAINVMLQPAYKLEGVDWVDIGELKLNKDNLMKVI